MVHNHRNHHLRPPSLGSGSGNGSAAWAKSGSGNGSSSINLDMTDESCGPSPGSDFANFVMLLGTHGWSSSSIRRGMRSCLKLKLIDTTTIGSIEFIGTGHETGSFRACRRLFAVVHGQDDSHW